MRHLRFNQSQQEERFEILTIYPFRDRKFEKLYDLVNSSEKKNLRNFKEVVRNTPGSRGRAGGGVVVVVVGGEGV